MNRIAATFAAAIVILIAAPAFAAPGAGTYEARVANVAGEGIAHSYICVKTEAKEVCAMADEAGRASLPAMSGPVTLHVIASSVGPVEVTLKRKARRTKGACTARFSNLGGSEQVLSCRFGA